MTFSQKEIHDMEKARKVDFENRVNYNKVNNTDTYCEHDGYFGRSIIGLMDKLICSRCGKLAFYDEK